MQLILLFLKKDNSKNWVSIMFKLLKIPKQLPPRRAMNPALRAIPCRDNSQWDLPRRIQTHWEFWSYTVLIRSIKDNNTPYLESAAIINGAACSSTKAGTIRIQSRSFHSNTHCWINSASFASIIATPESYTMACHRPNIFMPAGAVPPVFKNRSIAALRFSGRIL